MSLDPVPPETSVAATLPAASSFRKLEIADEHVLAGLGEPADVRREVVRQIRRQPANQDFRNGLVDQADEITGRLTQGHRHG